MIHSVPVVPASPPPSSSPPHAARPAVAAPSAASTASARLVRNTFHLALSPAFGLGQALRNYPARGDTVVAPDLGLVAIRQRFAHVDSTDPIAQRPSAPVSPATARCSTSPRDDGR